MMVSSPFTKALTKRRQREEEEEGDKEGIAWECVFSPQ